MFVIALSKGVHTYKMRVHSDMNFMHAGEATLVILSHVFFNGQLQLYMAKVVENKSTFLVWELTRVERSIGSVPGNVESRIAIPRHRFALNGSCGTHKVFFERNCAIVSRAIICEQIHAGCGVQLFAVRG